MDILLMIVYVVLILSVLVFVHEGGHFLAARAFGVRVTEFMLGFPGPHVGFNWHGTRFGVTAVPLGGYARVCGMDVDKESPHLERVLAFAYERGTVSVETVSSSLMLTTEDAYAALEELDEWGSLVSSRKRGEEELFRTPERDGFALGEPHQVRDPHELYESERSVQYRVLPFWKRITILLAGPAMNLLFAILLFILLYSIIGFDVQNTVTGEITHMTVDPVRAVTAGFNYIGMVFVAILNLFNPATAAETVSNSTSIMGIAVLSLSAAQAGLANFLFFTAGISVSLGLMNMLPIPPLDGGRFVVEIYQRLFHRPVGRKALGYMSAAGMLLFMAFFVFMLNQDIQRFVFGNWG